MADELEPVTQVFNAEFQPYIDEMKNAESEARQFAADNQVADEALKELTAAVRENSAMLAAYAAEMRGARDEAKKLAEDEVAAAEATGHLRDEAAEAAVSVNELGKQAKQTAAQLDLMGLSGASTLTSIGGLVGVIGGIVVAAAGVAPAVLAMGAGLGAFGLFAIPTFMEIAKNINATGDALAKLPAPIQFIIGVIHNIKTEYKALTDQFQIPVVNGLSLILTAVYDVLPKLIPLAQAGAQAFIMIARALALALESKGFADFLQLMTSLVIPATQAIMGLAGALTGVLGGAIDDLAAFSVPFINMLTFLVNALGPPLTAALRTGVQLFLMLGQVLSPLLGPLSEFATELINGVGSGFLSLEPTLRSVVSQLAGPLMSVLHALLPIIENTFTPNSPFIMAFKLLPDLIRAVTPVLNFFVNLLSNPTISQAAVWILSLVVAFRQLMVIVNLAKIGFAALTAVMEVNPIFLIISAIALLVVGFIELWNHCAGFRNFWISLWNDIKSIMAPVVSWIQNVIADMSRWWDDHGKTVIAILKAAWAIIEAIFKTSFELISGYIKSYFAIYEGLFKAAWDIISGVVRVAWEVISTIISSVVKIIQQTIDLFLNVIKGNWGAAWGNLKTIAQTQMNMVVTVIKDIASGFINILFNAGKDIIQGLINGVQSMFGSLGNIISGIGSNISNVFSSVLKIFSPSKVFYQHGINTMLGLVGGLQAGASAVYATVRGVANTVASTTIPAPASVYGAMAAAGAAPAASSSAASGGQIVVNVDGQKLFTIMQGQIYRYNVRNSGAVTGVVVPGLAA